MLARSWRERSQARRAGRNVVLTLCQQDRCPPQTRNDREIQQPHFWVFPKERTSVPQRDVCSPVFVVALFSVAKTRGQPECPPVAARTRSWGGHMRMCTWNFTQPFEEESLAFVAT